MKNVIWLYCLLIGLTLALPQHGISAISRLQATEIGKKESDVNSDKKVGKRISLKERIGKKFSHLKNKVKKWKEAVQLSLPSGKLLTSLIFLLASIILFAVGGLTTLGVLFNTLGSLAVILALLFFVLWLSERSKATSPTN